MDAMRIVSLLPSATEIFVRLGLGDAVVGVSHECDWPPEAAGGRPGPPRETSGFAGVPVRVTRPS